LLQSVDRQKCLLVFAFVGQFVNELFYLFFLAQVLHLRCLRRFGFLKVVVLVGVERAVDQSGKLRPASHRKAVLSSEFSVHLKNLNSLSIILGVLRHLLLGYLSLKTHGLHVCKLFDQQSETPLVELVDPLNLIDKVLNPQVNRGFRLHSSLISVVEI
jgi:hypothetical protein